MRNKFSTLIALLLVLALVIPTLSFAQDTELENKDLKERFFQLGFSEKEISNLTQEVIDKFEGINGTLVGEDTRYFKVITDPITRESEMIEYDEQTALRESNKLNMKREEIKRKIIQLEQSKKNQPEAEIAGIDDQIITLQSEWENDATSSWIQLTGYVSKISSTEYLFKNSYDWITSPLVILTDIIGIAHSEDWAIIADSEIGFFNYDVYWNGYEDTYGGCTCTTFKRNEYQYIYNGNPEGPNGMAMKFQLHHSMINYRYEAAYNHDGYIAYRVNTAHNNITNSNMFGTYHHQVITVSPSISITSGGISVSPSIAYSPANPVTVSFTVN